MMLYCQRLDHVVWHIIEWLVFVLWLTGFWRATGLCGWLRWIICRWTSTTRSTMTGWPCRYLVCYEMGTLCRCYWWVNSSALFCLIINSSCKLPVISSSPSSTTGSADISTFKSNISKSVIDSKEWTPVQSLKEKQTQSRCCAVSAFKIKWQTITL